MLVIDPDECIDCAVCVPECPVNAIYAEEDVPSDQRDFIAENATLASRWTLIARMKKAGYPFNVWMVPGPESAEYQIEYYAPQVEGSIWIAFYGTENDK